jgi:Zn-dependent protease
VTDLAARCASCGIELAPGLLACPKCRKLVHADRLKALAADAESAEREGRLTDALTHWRAALDLLPKDAAQHRAVTETIRKLGEAVDKAGVAGAARPGGTGKAAGLGVAALSVWKLKFVLLAILSKAKLLISGLASIPTLLSMLAFLAVDRGHGATFAVGLLISIYVHEMGHVSALRRYGIQATAPMFVPGLGAFVRLRQYPADAREDSRIGLAGPVWGCAASVVALAAGLVLRQPTLLAVASINASINLFNLIPFWQLDGARGFRALDVRQRGIVLAVAALGALALDTSMGWVICAVGGLRLKSDLPAQGDPRAFRTFTVLLVILSVVVKAGSASK